MDQGFPEDRSDQMTMLLINRSAVVVPLIVARLEEVLKSANPSNDFIDIASEMRCVSTKMRQTAKKFKELFPA